MKNHIALALVASTLLIAGCCTTPQPSAWEYLVVSPAPGGSDEPNKMAQQGWIVVNAYEGHNGGTHYLLKRLKKNP